MTSSPTIPTTGRSSAFQAKQLGFKSVTEFARSLPKNAVVYDIGAGVSYLGHDVVAVRSDITWVNIDPYYSKVGISDLDDGVSYRALDITKEDLELRDLYGTADMVYSYWMLPHLSLEDDQLARLAIQNMVSLLKKDGVLCVGPVRKAGIGLLSPFRYKGTLRYKQSHLYEDRIGTIVQMTKLWWLPRFVQRFSNKYHIHLLKRFVGGHS